jgi:hypothetical protein
MQLPSIDRTQSVRPLAAEAAALTSGRVVPVVPVNSPQQAAAPVVPTPSVINLINQADKPSVGEGVYSSVSDPTRRGAEAATPSKDWTIQRPAAEKVQDPPPEPISKMLMDQIKSLWLASAGAVQVQVQVRNQLDPTQQGIHAAPRVISTEVFTYSPTKIKKTEAPKN